ncbi:protein of unknown function [Parapedobacter luteus]|uniref:DUF3871 family protein n=1 Tax=Parapedobacter luteus TaxID=623280 RepID=A0A1T5C991_9SPHI|nr:DUF3871 family protein [Parapedobacter luteus]SKB55997.1 protein of unknown function [Parapedobacter luteus]
METLELNGSSGTLIADNQPSTSKPFLEANTVAATLDEIRDKHLIPVFAKDNQPVISQSDFISLTSDVVQHFFQHETVLPPSIRISHPIKGRIPEAKDKPAHLLREEEKTIYYERMAFILEIPTISDTINGNPLSLTVGGIKAHNQDNLYARKGVEEHFKLFIGFQNRVCTNMCVWTDGTKETLRVRSIDELTEAIIDIISSYDAKRHLDRLSGFTEYSINEDQFAYLIGRARMYQHMPNQQKKNLPQLLFGDNQIGMVVKEYYNDSAFSREDDGSLNLWKLYNLFTGANKSSYIDGFLNRGLNAYGFVSGIREAMDSDGDNWFML